MGKIKQQFYQNQTERRPLCGRLMRCSPKEKLDTILPEHVFGKSLVSDCIFLGRMHPPRVPSGPRVRPFSYCERIRVMSRRKGKGFDYCRLKPADIPPDLVARGWRRKSDFIAERRLADGRCDAWVDTISRFVVWGGGLGFHRQLVDYFDDAVSAMYAVEAADAEGPLSAKWRSERGAPQFDGWTHEVHQKRDVWYRGRGKLP